MKVRLDDVHSPCRVCFLKGIFYDPDSIMCQRCEYNIAIQLLKKILRVGSQCSFCKKYRTGCAALEGDCNYLLDFNEVCRAYNIEVEE